MAFSNAMPSTIVHARELHRVAMRFTDCEFFLAALDLTSVETVPDTNGTVVMLLSAQFGL